MQEQYTNQMYKSYRGETDTIFDIPFPTTKRFNPTKTSNSNYNQSYITLNKDIKENEFNMQSKLNDRPQLLPKADFHNRYDSKIQINKMDHMGINNKWRQDEGLDMEINSPIRMTNGSTLNRSYEMINPN
eukprot:TRINITY_DN8686_c0_g1_i1.p1 TRINITY_DN8686_c0_g1~~TRINITY_DN8686_c0_g1_i1.p1  ORF type:complete len:130 (+),score=26.09 TRINITY_DN8686_c0_g1_i1:13-402(+)